jgi:hypothetical protein
MADIVAVVEVEVGKSAEVEVGKFEEVGIGFVGLEEGTLTAGGVPVGCLGSLGLACLQGNFLQAPLFPLHSFFCFQGEWQTKRLPKTPL